MALAQILRVAHSIELRIEEDLAALGLSLAKMGALRALVGANEPLPLGALAERIGCVRSNVTQLVDRLEGDGLVRRVPDPGDRRVRRAELTEAGRRAHAAGWQLLQAHDRAVVEALGADLPAVTEALDRL